MTTGGAVFITVKRKIADVRFFETDVLVAVLGRDRRGLHRLHHTRESCPCLIELIEKFVKEHTDSVGIFVAHEGVYKIGD